MTVYMYAYNVLLTNTCNMYEIKILLLLLLLLLLNGLFLHKESAFIFYVRLWHYNHSIILTSQTSGEVSLKTADSY